MTPRISEIIKYFSGKPKILFLIDGFGALLTASLLFFVLRNFNEYFGMPKKILTYLSAIAACFFIYSICFYLFIKGFRTISIRAIGIANLMYCLLTLGLVISYYSRLTVPGITYFILEIMLVFGLVYIEFKVAAGIEQTRIITK